MNTSSCNNSRSVLDDVFEARTFFGNCHKSLSWGFLNAFLALIIYLDLSFGCLIGYIANIIPQIPTWYLVNGLVTLLIFNTIYHFVRYMKIKSFKSVEVSRGHKKLCKISENENGFQMASPVRKKKFEDCQQFMVGPTFSPSNYQSYISSPLRSFNNSFNSQSFNSSFNHKSPPAAAPSSIERNDYSFKLSPNSSFRSANLNESLMSPDSMKSFIKQQTENELRLRREQTIEKSPKYMMDTSMEYYPGRFQYQLARSPAQLQPLLNEVSPDPVGAPSLVESDIWSKLNVSQERLDLWLERLRKYLGQTILLRLSESIEATNKALVSAGHEDIKIGYVNLATLKHLAANKSHVLPQLPALIPFLEASTNQEYLVQRIKELSTGGCISSFKWNSGGEFRGKKWEENLPTDSALLMHFLCCYMDSRLPPHPKHLDGKQFTCQHFFKAIDKPNVSELKESAHFHEVSTHPPHYEVISDGTIIQLKKGRLNIFHAILAFFYLIKIKEHGMLRRVSLGLSGINILWIFDD